MAEQSYPFGTVDAFEVEWRRMARLWAPTGLAGPVGSDQGRIVIGDSGTIKRLAAPDGGWVDGHGWVDDADWIQTPPPNLASGPRIDRVVAKVVSGVGVVTQIVPGTAASSPSGTPQPPTIQQVSGGNYSMVFGSYRMPPAGQPQVPSDPVDERSWSLRKHIELDHVYGEGARISPTGAFVPTDNDAPPLRFWAPPGLTFTVEVHARTTIVSGAEQVIGANARVVGATGGLADNNELINTRWPPVSGNFEPKIEYKGAYTATGGMVDVRPRWAIGFGATQVIIRGAQIFVTL